MLLDTCRSGSSVGSGHRPARSASKQSAYSGLGSLPAGGPQRKRGVYRSPPLKEAPGCNLQPGATLKVLSLAQLEGAYDAAGITGARLLLARTGFALCPGERLKAKRVNTWVAEPAASLEDWMHVNPAVRLRRDFSAPALSTCSLLGGCLEAGDSLPDEVAPPVQAFTEWFDSCRSVNARRKRPEDIEPRLLMARRARSAKVSAQKPPSSA
eukprot:TRINITY_DN36788_c0_g1_i2.p1 TRINITY_DN36788_c0_g1~~TRINITY_DN36788_c0_g1_i2.p1  ORF type:complete len:211 (-),score=24.04 TRINITY_DN36788_c0_g1_i2:87-719(-)